MVTNTASTFKNFLVPTDFSDCAYNALKYAASMAKTVDASIMIYHTVFHPITKTGAVFIKSKDSMFADREAKMKELCERIRVDPVFDGINYEYVVDEKEILEGINAIASGNDTNLIVIGTKGASGLLGSYLGSFTSEVVSHSTFPVLAIPIQSSWRKPENIVLALDRGEHYQKDDFTILAQLSAYYSANITVVDVIEKDKALVWDTKAIKTWLPNIAFNEHTIQGKGVDTLVNEYAEREEADWLAVVPLSSNFIDYLLNRNVSREFALHTKMPLLALR